jgi:hypothetical protein
LWLSFSAEFAAWRGNTIASLNASLKSLSKALALLVGSSTVLTAARFLTGGESLVGHHVLAPNSHDGFVELMLAILLCFAVAIFDHVKNAKVRMETISTLILIPTLVFYCYHFETQKYSAPGCPWPYNGFLGSVLIIFWWGTLFVSFLWLIYTVGSALVSIARSIASELASLARSIATRFREASKLCIEFGERSNLLLTVNFSLILVRGVQDGEDFAYSIRESVEHVRRFDPVLARKKYFWEAVKEIPCLAFLEFQRQLCKEVASIAASCSAVRISFARRRMAVLNANNSLLP